MSHYRKIDVRIWNDAKFNSLSDQAQLLFFFILTHPTMTMIGGMRATLAGLAAEKKWTEKAFREAFREALAKGMLKHDPDAHFLWAVNFLKYNRPESPNVVKSWESSLDLLPECRLKNQLIQSVKAFVEGLSEGFREALPEAFRKTIPNQEQEQEHEHKQEHKQEKKNVRETVSYEPTCFYEFWRMYPDNCPRKVRKVEAEKKWRLDKLDEKFDQVMEGLERWKVSQQWADDDGKYIPAPVVFLSKKLYEDNPKPFKFQHKGGERLNKNISAAQEWLEEKQAQGGENDAI